MKDIFKEFDEAPMIKRIRCLYTLFQDAVYIREDAWFHYQDGLPYEIKNSKALEVLGDTLKRMSENNGKLRKNEPARKHRKR